METGRFNNGRIVIGLRSFSILSNNGSTIALKGNPPQSRRVAIRSQFTLYDDDDYNADDARSDGDNNEQVVTLPDSFRYLSAEDGNYPDGKPKNIYASAYIMPEYNWAQNVTNYNQTNLTFALNVEDSANNFNVINVVNRNRDSKNDEKDSFWISYVLIGYQGPVLLDFDGVSPNGTTNETARQGVSPNIFVNSEIPSCDCYLSSNCPQGAAACVLSNGTPKLPRGAFGSIIFQEVNQDLKKYFSLLQPPYTARTIEDIKLTIPHEIRHQFGLLGDQTRLTFKIMDYSNYINNAVNDELFHAEHINILRRRITSPGL